MGETILLTKTVLLDSSQSYSCSWLVCTHAQVCIVHVSLVCSYTLVHFVVALYTSWSCLHLTMLLLTNFVWKYPLFYDNSVHVLLISPHWTTNDSRIQYMTNVFQAVTPNLTKLVSLKVGAHPEVVMLIFVKLKYAIFLWFIRAYMYVREWKLWEKFDNADTLSHSHIWVYTWTDVFLL